MAARSFNKSSHKIIDIELNEGLALLAGNITPEADEVRFDLYQDAVARAKNANRPIPDLPDCVAGACARLINDHINDQGFRGPRADMWLPQDVKIAYGQLKEARSPQAAQKLDACTLR